MNSSCPVTKSSLDFSVLIENLKDIEPELVVVFGSYLTNPTSARDIDLLVISKSFDGVYYQDRRMLLPKFYDGKKVDPQCFTPSEFDFLFDRNNPLIKSISNKHITLIGEFDDLF
jgi:predicted nucleotidyltransferase